MIERRYLGAPARFDDGGGVPLGDNRGAVDLLADGERLAQKDRRFARPSHFYVSSGDGRRARLFRLFIGRLFIGGRFGEDVRLTDGFDRDRFDDDLPAGHQEAEAPLVSRLEIPSHVCDLAEWRNERRVRSFVAQMSALAEFDALGRRALAQNFYRGGSRERANLRANPWQRRILHPRLHRLLPHRRDVGQPHAVGRQHPRERMDINAGHSHFFVHQAGMLSARAAETGQRVLGHVVSALHGDALDGVGHVGHGDPNEALSHMFRLLLFTGRVLDLGGKLIELLAYYLDVKRLVSVRPEHFWEIFWLNLPQHDVAVGDRQRPAAPVTGWAGIGAGRIRADAIALAVEMQDRAAAGRDGVDRQHWGAHAHAGHLRLELALEFAGVM